MHCFYFGGVDTGHSFTTAAHPAVCTAWHIKVFISPSKSTSAISLCYSVSSYYTALVYHWVALHTKQITMVLFQHSLPISIINTVKRSLANHRLMCLEAKWLHPCCNRMWFKCDKTDSKEFSDLSLSVQLLWLGKWVFHYYMQMFYVMNELIKFFLHLNN